MIDIAWKPDFSAPLRFARNDKGGDAMLEVTKGAT